MTKDTQSRIHNMLCSMEAALITDPVHNKGRVIDCITRIKGAIEADCTTPQSSLQPTALDVIAVESTPEPMICIDGDYYDNIEALLEHMDIYSKEDLLEHLPEGITVQDCKSIPVYQFDPESVFELTEGCANWPEEADAMENDLLNAIKRHIPALNADVPKVWIPNGEKTYYTLEELEGML